MFGSLSLNFLIENYMQRRRKCRKGSFAPRTMLSLLRKDLREGNLQALLGGSSYGAPPPPTATPDPFISSLIYTLPLDESLKDARPESFDEGTLGSKISDEKVVDRYVPIYKFSITLYHQFDMQMVLELYMSLIFCNS